MQMDFKQLPPLHCQNVNIVNNDSSLFRTKKALRQYHKHLEEL